MFNIRLIWRTCFVLYSLSDHHTNLCLVMTCCFTFLSKIRPIYVLRWGTLPGPPIPARSLPLWRKTVDFIFLIFTSSATAPSVVRFCVHLILSRAFSCSQGIIHHHHCVYLISYIKTSHLYTFIDDSSCSFQVILGNWTQLPSTLRWGKTPLDIFCVELKNETDYDTLQSQLWTSNAQIVRFT